MKRVILICVSLLAVGLFGGCQKPLFPENLPRTQYDRFDRLRGTFTPQERVGPYGDPIPALRARLTPYD